jgi:hypothetical protein
MLCKRPWQLVNRKKRLFRLNKFYHDFIPSDYKRFDVFSYSYVGNANVCHSDDTFRV